MHNTGHTGPAAYEPQEISGKEGVAAVTSQEADRQADHLIKQLLAEQDGVAGSRALPEAPQGKAKAGGPAIRHPRRFFGRRGPEAKTGKPLKTNADATETGTDPAADVAPGLWARISAYRPTRKHVFVAAVAAIMLWRPWLLPVLLFVSFLIVLIAYFSLGPDRVAELVVSNWRRLHARRPELAENLRQRAEQMARRIDAFLDRLPAKWTDGIHVPDFAAPETDLDELPDPFERLARKA